MCKKRKKLNELSLRELKIISIFSDLLFLIGFFFSLWCHFQFPNFNPIIIVILPLSLFFFAVFIAYKTQLKIEDKK